jgi:hypothetical protein
MVNLPIIGSIKCQQSIARFIMECKSLFPNVLGFFELIPKNRYRVTSLTLGHFVFHYSIVHSFVQCS